MDFLLYALISLNKLYNHFFFSSLLKNWEFWKSSFFYFDNISCVSSIAFAYLWLGGWLDFKLYFFSYNGSVYSADEGPD